MSATTTNLKAQVQARIDAANAGTALRDLMILRKSAQGLGCNESNLDTLVTSKLNAMSAGTAHIDLIIGNQASDINTTKATPLGTYVGVPITAEPKFTINGMTFLTQGYFETTDFDPVLLPLSYRTYGPAGDSVTSPRTGNTSSPVVSFDTGSSGRSILHFKGTQGGSSYIDNILTATNMPNLPAPPALAANDAAYKWLTGLTWLCRTLGTLHISTDDGATWTDISSRIATIGSTGLPVLACNGAGVVLANTGSAEGVLARSTNNAGSFSGTTITLPGTSPICHGAIFVNATTCIAYGTATISASAKPVIWVSTNSGSSFGSPVEVAGTGSGTAITNALLVNSSLYLNKTDRWFTTVNYSSFTEVSGSCAAIKFSIGVSQDGILVETSGGTNNSIRVGLQRDNGVPDSCRCGLLVTGRQILFFDTSKTGTRYKTGVGVVKASLESTGHVAMRIK